MSNPTAGTSDYRSAQMENTTKTYSTALIEQQFPTKEQAIVFPSIENLKLQDYLISLGKLIEPKNILFSSRLSNNRVCMYLANKNVVENFMNNYGGSIEINNQKVQARKLITPSQRLILSNACPSIPHAVLIQEIEKLGLQPMSPMSFLKISAGLPEFNHIYSFRRQIFITPPLAPIPESILMNYDNTNYRIYFAQDSLICFSCKRPGHTAANCKTIQESVSENYNQNPHSQSSSQPIPSEILSTNPSKTPTSQPIINIDTTQSTQNSSKRSLDDIVTPPLAQDANSENQSLEPFVKPNVAPAKKPKKSKGKTPTHVLMEPTKAFISEQNPSFVLDFDQISDLFENVYGAQDPVSIIKNYTSEFEALVKMLTAIYPYFKQRSIKARCTKIRKKLLKHLQMAYSDTEASETESEFSQE